MEVRLPKFSKKVAAIAGAAGLAMGAAGIAAAYFSTSGTGSGAAKVGSATPFTVTFTPTTTTLFPSHSQTLLYSITNSGGGNQKYTITTADYAVVQVGGDVKTTGGAHSGTYISGCTASWYSFSAGSHSATLAAGASSGPLTVSINMSNGTGTGSTQDACEGVHPVVNLHFTS